MSEPKLMRVKPQPPEFGPDLPGDPMERLIYFARLAPSTNNTQPWRLVHEPGAVDVFAEPELIRTSRRPLSDVMIRGTQP